MAAQGCHAGACCALVGPRLPHQIGDLSTMTKGLRGSPRPAEVAGVGQAVQQAVTSYIQVALDRDHSRPGLQPRTTRTRRNRPVAMRNSCSTGHR